MTVDLEGNGGKYERWNRRTHIAWFWPALPSFPPNPVQMLHLDSHIFGGTKYKGDVLVAKKIKLK